MVNYNKGNSNDLRYFSIIKPMLKDKLLKYRVFQELVKIKLGIKGFLHKSKISERRYDRKSFVDFKKLVENPDYIYEKEIEFLPSFIRNGDVVVDIGANRGEYSFYLSKFVGENGMVLAFEPGNRAFKILRKIKDYYKLNNLRIYNMAVTNKIGNETLIVPYFNRQSQLQTEQPIKGRKENVITNTLDNFLNDEHLSHVEFIKCDTEGSEYLVFSGAVNSIGKFKPVILVEIADLHSIRFGHNASDILELLKGHGYALYYYHHEIKKLIKTDKIELKTDSHVWSRKSGNLSNNNYFFIHSSKVADFQKYILN